MADTFSKEKRSAIMRNIKGVNTAPEIIVRKYLFKHGYRFSLHRKNLPGTPDIVLRKFKTVIFINGCFWHGHVNCKKSSLPKTNIDFWRNKITRNTQKDFENMNDLKKLGWNVITIYQCELRSKNFIETMSKVMVQLTF